MAKVVYQDEMVDDENGNNKINFDKLQGPVLPILG